MGSRWGLPRQRGTAAPGATGGGSVRRAGSGCPVSAVLVVALVTAQLIDHLSGGARPAWVGVLVTGLCLLALPIAASLWSGRMGECRFFAVTVAALVAGGQVLVATVGGPGGEPAGWTPGGVLVVALGAVTVLAVPGLATLRARAGRAVHLGGVADPYASADGTPAAGRGGRRRHRRAPATHVGA